MGVIWVSNVHSKDVRWMRGHTTVHTHPSTAEIPRGKSPLAFSSFRVSAAASFVKYMRRYDAAWLHCRGKEKGEGGVTSVRSPGGKRDDGERRARRMIHLLPSTFTYA